MRATWWELAAAMVLTACTLSLAAWWALLEWLDQRAARRPAPAVSRHRASNGERTRRIYPNRYRRP